MAVLKKLCAQKPPSQSQLPLQASKKATPIKELPLKFWEINLFSFSETYQVSDRVAPLPFQK